MDLLLSVGFDIKTPNFSAIFPRLKNDIEYLKNNVLPNVSPEMAQSEAAKGAIPGKPMLYLDILRAAELDGLVK